MLPPISIIIDTSTTKCLFINKLKLTELKMLVSSISYLNDNITSDSFICKNSKNGMPKVHVESNPERQLYISYVDVPSIYFSPRPFMLLNVRSWWRKWLWCVNITPPPGYSCASLKWRLINWGPCIFLSHIPQYAPVNKMSYNK